jgi:hypothetical protein
MAIAVICPGCKASFRVSDKYAGQTGPCPKCKAPIQIPKVANQEVKVHAPEASGPKDSKGRSISKPLLRLETEVSTVQIVITLGCVLVAFFAAWLLGGKLQEKLAVRLIGLSLVTPPLALLGYFFLRDREKLEIFSGMELWLRTGICTAVYLVLWAAFAIARQQLEMPTEVWHLFIMLPPLLLFGAMAALGCYELDFANAILHCCMNVLVIVALGYIAGMPYLSLGV